MFTATRQRILIFLGQLCGVRYDQVNLRQGIIREEYALSNRFSTSEVRILS